MFHRPPVPSAIVRLGTKDPIVFSHVASDVAMPAPTLAAPLEEAFSVHVHHLRLSHGDIWLEGRHRAMPLVHDLARRFDPTSRRRYQCVPRDAECS